MSHSNINVTPLIDVLLVLLIIFMITAPSKPTDFKTRIPQEAKDKREEPHPLALVVALGSDSALRLNKETDLGTIDQPDKLIARLQKAFLERTNNLTYAADRALKIDIPESEKIEKTVYIKAPRSIDYGSVVKVVDAVKFAGANPISLQIDDLE